VPRGGGGHAGRDPHPRHAARGQEQLVGAQRLAEHVEEVAAAVVELVRSDRNGEAVEIA